jgi:protein SCO1/2
VIDTFEHQDSPIARADVEDPVRFRVIVIAVVAVLVLVAGLVVGFSRQGGSATSFVELDRPVEMPDVVLIDTDGEPFSLRDDTAGRVTLLYFGYLSCPDACPIHMAVLGNVFEQLPGEARDHIDVVFVTTDPTRDSPAELRAYLDAFDPSFIGLTGSTEALRDAQVAAGVPVAVAEPTVDNGNYLVGHATQVLVFDRDGVARRVYPFGVRQSDWLADLPTLVSNPAS